MKTSASGRRTNPIPRSSSSEANVRPEASVNEIRRGSRAIRAVAAEVDSVSSPSDLSTEASTGSQSLLAMASESYLGVLPSGNAPTRKRSGARTETSTIVEPASRRRLRSS